MGTYGCKIENDNGSAVNKKSFGSFLFIGRKVSTKHASIFLFCLLFTERTQQVKDIIKEALGYRYLRISWDHENNPQERVKYRVYVNQYKKSETFTANDEELGSFYYETYEKFLSIEGKMKKYSKIDSSQLKILLLQI